VLSILSRFRVDDPRLDTIVEHLLDQQMEDGGWILEHRSRARSWFQKETIRRQSRWTRATATG
jgi:hypothetical protein